MDRASMAPKMGVSSQLPSLMSTQGWGGLLGRGVPGQQLVWSVVSAASLVEGA